MDRQLILYTLIIQFLIIFLILGLLKLRKKTLLELNKVLYFDNNPIQYQQLLMNNHLRILFSKNQIELLRLEGWIITGNEKEIKNCIDQINTKKLSKRERVDLCSALVFFLYSTYYLEDTSVVLNSICKETKTDINNLQLLYKVNVLKEQDLIPTLEKNEKKFTGQRKKIAESLLIRVKNYKDTETSQKLLMRLVEELEKPNSYDEFFMQCLNY